MELARQDKIDERNFQLKEKQKDRDQDLMLAKAKTTGDNMLAEKQVPGFGQALTKDDAKATKDAIESYRSYKQLVGEMKTLREKYGAESWNRDAVSRGQQLSKAALLKLKNLAKLGVLSQSDEKIINEIIPADPLGLSYTMFTDAIMAKLDGALGDADKEFKNYMSSRGFDDTAVEQFVQNNAIPPVGSQTAGSLLSETALAAGNNEVPKLQPGSIVEYDGVKYKVGPDGDKLIDLSGNPGQVAPSNRSYGESSIDKNLTDSLRRMK
jgi:hypothetical protein